MFEITSNLSIKDHQSQLAAASEPFSLPAIAKKPVSRGQVTSRKGMTQKQKFVLPSIYNSERDVRNTTDLQLEKENVQHLNKSAFAREVKEKLNLVLGEMPQMQSIEHDDYGSDDSDFEAKINENKQIIKQHRLKREGDLINLANPSQKNANEAKPKKPLKLRNESLYQKRVKQYKDQSVENKYLQKRKQTIKQKTPSSPSNKNLNMNKDTKPKDESNSNKQQRVEGKRSLSKRNQTRALSHKVSQKNISEFNKSMNLFDNIQNYLENPKQNKKQEDQKQLVGLALLKAKRDIEDKIKAINEKIGTAQSESSKNLGSEKVIDMNTSARDWRRVEFKEQKVNYQSSNFDKQLDRINSLQEKNSMCLEKYLQHQKILLDLELRKKQLPRKLHIVSK